VNTARRELFVYYRVPEEAWQQAGAAVVEFQRRLREEHPELKARVLRRPQSRGQQVTLMELYALDPQQHPDGIDATWLTRIESTAVVMRRWQRGERHVEWFDPVD
jgi:Domain of unknown function (DUF4936)